MAGFIGSNLMAAAATDPQAANQVYNVAVGERTTLNDLYTRTHSQSPEHPWTNTSPI